MYDCSPAAQSFLDVALHGSEPGVSRVWSPPFVKFVSQNFDRNNCMCFLPNILQYNCKPYKMWHLWQRYKQKSPFQESTQAPQLCFCYTVRVIGRERHEQNFNELSVFGKLNLIISHNLIKWPQDWQGQTRSHGSRSKLLVDIQPGHEVVSNTNQRWGWLDPLQARIQTWKAPHPHVIASLSNATTRTDIICFICQYHEVMKMTGHLDDGFYHAQRHQQSRVIKALQNLSGQQAKEPCPTFCGKPSWFCCTQWCSSPLRHSSTKNLATVAVGWNLPVVEARLVLCRTDSCVSENHATKAYLMRRPTGKSNEMSWRSSSAKISSIRTNNYESKFCLTPLHTFPLAH